MSMMERFVDEHINVTEYLPNLKMDDVRRYGIDALVVGSDQIWSPRITGDDSVFFLHNIGCPDSKVSYAASMGNACFDEDVLKKYENDIKQFSSLSVRENSFYEVLRNRNIECSITPDPTLLLSSHEW